ncbi:hypothetical protein ACSN7O_004828, partial [Enterobacter chuandaensis]
YSQARPATFVPAGLAVFFPFSRHAATHFIFSFPVYSVYFSRKQEHPAKKTSFPHFPDRALPFLQVFISETDPFHLPY